jgi:hypothetical protein
MDLLTNELELLSIALEELLSSLTPLPNGDTGNLNKDLTKLSNRINKEIQTRIEYDQLQFEQLANF